jgi:Rrf2 family protein
MRLSTKSTYGLRAMLNIALNGRTGAMSVADISRREGISTAYLEQLLNRLRRASLIKSVRGPKGGYVLLRGAADITVGDIVKALEGGIYPAHCVSADPSVYAVCRKSKGCVPKIVWHKLYKAINDCLESMTLKDLCAEAKKIG